MYNVKDVFGCKCSKSKLSTVVHKAVASTQIVVVGQLPHTAYIFVGIRFREFCVLNKIMRN